MAFNPLEMTKRQIAIITFIAVTAGIVYMLVMFSAAAKELGEAQVLLNKADSAQVDAFTGPTAAPKSADEPQATTAPKATAQPTQQRQAVQPEPVKTEPKDGGHVPFTNKDVTPGQPETYVDTVGQCPFYEMAGPKGCYPPADIVCNDDWTVCGPR